MFERGEAQLWLEGHYAGHTFAFKQSGRATSLPKPHENGERKNTARRARVEATSALEYTRMILRNVRVSATTIQLRIDLYS